MLGPTLMQPCISHTDGFWDRLDCGSRIVSFTYYKYTYTKMALRWELVCLVLIMQPHGMLPYNTKDPDILPN